MEQKLIFSKLKDYYDAMCKNAENFEDWLNIPLAKEALNLIKTEALEEDREIAMDFCETMIDEDLVDPWTTPRLALSFIEHYHHLAGDTSKWEKLANDLRVLMDPNVSEAEKISVMKQHMSLVVDPIQFTQKWEDVYEEVAKEYGEHYKGQKPVRGMVHERWNYKKELLKRHGIDWRTPAVMNPRVRID